MIGQIPIGSFLDRVRPPPSPRCRSPGETMALSGVPHECHRGTESDARTTSRTMTRMRWAIIWLAFIGLSINYLDRSSLSVALPFMGDDFQLSGTQKGMIFAAFFWSYDVCQLAAGWYVDKVGRAAPSPSRRCGGRCAQWPPRWRGDSARCSRSGSSSAWARAGAEHSAKVVATWFPKSERAFATSIWDSGSRVVRSSPYRSSPSSSPS